MPRVEDLRKYSKMIREQRGAKKLTTAELSLKAGVSTRTLSLIENEQWPKTGFLSRQQKKGQARALKSLAPVLSFSASEWLEKLDIPDVEMPNSRVTIVDKDDLEFLVRLVEVTGPIRIDSALDLLGQRKK